MLGLAAPTPYDLRFRLLDIPVRVNPLFWLVMAILSGAETGLLESNAVRVVSRQRQGEMIREVEGQQNAVFNPAHVAKYGKQLLHAVFIVKRP